MDQKLQEQAFRDRLLNYLPCGILVLKVLKNYKSLDSNATTYINPQGKKILKKLGTKHILNLLNLYAEKRRCPAEDCRVDIDENHYIDVTINSIGDKLLVTISNKKILPTSSKNQHKNKFNFIINKEGGLTYADEDFLALSSYSLDELSNIHFKNFLYNQKEWADIERRLIQKGVLRHTNIAILTKSGEIVPCKLKLNAVYNKFGKSVAYKGIIKKNKIVEEPNEEILYNIKQKLDTTQKIARLVAHEVRNPITNINLALEQLKQGTKSKTGSNKHAFCTEVIKRNCSRINMLVNQLLNTSITEYLIMKPCLINEIIEKTISLAIDRIRLNEVAVIKILSKDKNAVIGADTEKLTIAFLNIIINAIEAMEPERGILTIRTDAQKEAITVKIQDNGKGIEEKQIEQIFKPFYTNKQAGIGLGLTSAHNIIQSHKGEIKISSKAKKGSTFSIHFYK